MFTESNFRWFDLHLSWKLGKALFLSQLLYKTPLIYCLHKSLSHFQTNGKCQDPLKPYYRFYIFLIYRIVFYIFNGITYYIFVRIN